MRIFPLALHFIPNDGEPIRTEVIQSDDAAIIAWHLKPGQVIKPHQHPSGQDTWTIISGNGNYIMDEKGSTMPITTGDVVVAKRGEVHGVRNCGDRDLTFVSVVSPAVAGCQLVE